MGRITCTYCEAEVDEDDVEKDGGCCPECGMIMGISAMFGDDDDDDDDDFEDEDDGDDDRYDD